jgi:hypothetical protein
MATYTDVTTFSRDVMPASESIDANLLQQAAMIATAYIDSRLAMRYTVPLTAPYPEEIIAISNMLTRLLVSDLQQKRAPLMPKAGAKDKRGSMDGGYGFPMMWLDQIVQGKALVAGLTPNQLTDTWGPFTYRNNTEL